MSEITSGQMRSVAILALQLYETAPNYATPVGLDALKEHVEMLEKRRVFVDATVKWLDAVLETGEQLCKLTETWTDEPQPSVAAWKELMK